LGSDNYGETFKIIKDIQARSISFGVGKTNSSDPVMYLLGKRGDEEGLFASEDMGKTFVRVSDDEHKLGKGGFLEADRRVYGRVYIGTGGRGVIIGEVTK
jgi:oligoxyloglucan reducing-end-specific cellobiohydrolase